MDGERQPSMGKDTTLKIKSRGIYRLAIFGTTMLEIHSVLVLITCTKAGRLLHVNVTAFTLRAFFYFYEKSIENESMFVTLLCVGLLQKAGEKRGKL